MKQLFFSQDFTPTGGPRPTDGAGGATEDGQGGPDGVTEDGGPDGGDGVTEAGGESQLSGLALLIMVEGCAA